MKLTGYKRCPSCNTIFKDESRSTANPGNIAPCCGAVDEMREHWPSLDKLISLDLVEKQNLDDYNERKVAIVFVCVLLEMLLEETVRLLISRHVRSVEATEALLDSAQGRDRRIKLFKKLSGIQLQDVLDKHGYHDFLTQWKEMVQLRNQVAHRGFHGHSEMDINVVIQNLLNRCVPVFVLLNNTVTQTPINQP